MKFRREFYSEALMNEMQPLFEDHNAEIPQLGLPIEPDFLVYKMMDISGHLRIFTARIGSVEDNVLVGYQFFFLSRHPHRKGSFEATQDILYFDPQVRKGLAGVKFLKWCDKELEKDGVQVIHHPIDAKHDFGSILKRMGYELTDVTYARRTGVHAENVRV